MRGPQVTAGYLGRPDATAALIDADGWLRTGDLGFVDADGNVYVVDRLKELIKVDALPGRAGRARGAAAHPPARRRRRRRRRAPTPSAARCPSRSSSRARRSTPTS